MKNWISLYNKSARNPWSMKKWYSFYSGAPEFGDQIQSLTEQLDLGSIKLNQIGAENGLLFYVREKTLHLNRHGKQEDLAVIRMTISEKRMKDSWH